VKHTISLLAILLVTASFRTAAAAPRRIDMNFNGQLASAVDELRQKMDADSELKGRKLRLGKFSAPLLPDSSFELEFEQRFRTLLKDRLDDASEFFVIGEYNFLPGVHPNNEGLRVVQFSIRIINRQRRTLHEVVREVNDTADIARITGTTVAPPDTTDFEERNEAAAEAFDEPQFATRSGTQVTAAGDDRYAVEIRRRAGGTGSPVAITPRSVNGMAFVDLDVADTFEIVLYSYETACDASALVTIDGLDVANTFSQDRVKYDGYLVSRARGSARPGTHTIPGWLGTTRRQQDNVFSFVVNELGKGAATALKSRSSRGVINVQFFEAVPPDQQLPSRSFGEVGKGKPMTVRYDVRPVKRRDVPAANISIRYSQVR
jgi:hypothetical protein